MSLGRPSAYIVAQGYGSLAPCDPNDTADNVIDMDPVRWMLSQFATVEEVKAASTITFEAVGDA